MFLQPRKRNYKKIKQNKLRKLGFKGTKVIFGSAGLKATTSGLISARQLEAARRSITRKLQKKGKVWVRIFPDYPITGKPGESRMGKGTGSISFWSSQVLAGKIIFEVAGVPTAEAVKALIAGGYKIPLKTRILL